MPAYNAFFDQNFPNCLLATHESAAAFMAIAWASLRGVPPLVLGTTGPGATNMATGLATAFIESVPLIAITGEVPSSELAKRTYQESSGFGRTVDTVALLSGVTKRSGRVVTAAHFAELLATWVPLARSGRPGPVHLSVPSDIWQHDIPDGLFADCLSSMIQSPSILSPTPSDLQATAAALEKAQRPLLLTGRGLTMGAAGHAAVRCASNWGITHVTTARGKGAVPYISGLSLGHLGPGGCQALEHALANWKPDFMLCVGTSLGGMALGRLPALMGQRPIVFQVNIDPEERGAVWKCDQFFHSDAGSFLGRLADLAPTDRILREKPTVLSQKAQPSRSRAESGDSIHPREAMKVLSSCLPEAATIVPDCGNHWLWAMHLLRNCRVNGWLPGRAFGAMGQGAAAAVGASVTMPDHQVVAITGDGSFLTHGAEAVSAVAKRARVLWIVFNDGVLGRIRTAQIDDFGGRVHSTSFPPIDFAKVASAYGLWSRRVHRLDDLELVLKEALRIEGPALIDVCIDSQVSPP